MNTRAQQTLRLAFLCILFAGIFSGEEKAFAGVVYGNGSLSDTAHLGGFGYGAHDAYAMPFTVGSSATSAQRTLTGAYILVRNDTANAVSTTIEIYDTTSVNAGPNTLLGSGSLSLGGTGLNSIWQYIPFSSPVVLTQSGNYYFAVAAAAVDQSQFAWQQPNANRTYSDLGSGSGYQLTGSANTFWTISNGGTAWTDYGASTTVAGNPQAFQLVPEPSTYAMLLAGLGCGAVEIIRRRRHSAPTP